MLKLLNMFLKTYLYTEGEKFWYIPYFILTVNNSMLQIVLEDIYYLVL